VFHATELYGDGARLFLPAIATPFRNNRNLKVKKFIALSISLALTACASTYQPIAPDYTGFAASVSDSGSRQGGSAAEIFAVTEVDGNRIMNSFWASARASQGRGFSLTMEVTERRLPTRPMKLTLKGSHTAAAPIEMLAKQMAGTFFSVEGVANFTPKADGRYVVKGELKKGASSVWIEDADTGEVVTTKIVER
jgi:hypothetical protein